MDTGLIYDVGAHNGDDTAYYLSKGYRVVAVEPDPNLAGQIRRRFEQELRVRQLTLLELAVGPQRGPARFWLCDQVSEWNSFDQRNAAQLGMRHHPIDVHCSPFRDILREYGVPYYLKVDIESYDHYCIAGIDIDDPPEFVSVELSGVADVSALAAVGYTRFKIIRQGRAHGHLQFEPDPPGSGSSRSTGAVSRRPARRPSPGHGAPGPSGSFGEEADGRWHSFAETEHDVRSFFEGTSRYGNPPDWFVWFDIHAARP